MPGGYDANTPIRFNVDMVTEEFARWVREYAWTVTRKNAVLWYGFCPMNALAVEASAAEIDAFFEALQKKLNLPLAGDPHDFILDAGWFYDTNFHPNSSGKTVYTRELVRAIKAMPVGVAKNKRRNFDEDKAGVQSLCRCRIPQVF